MEHLLLQITHHLHSLAMTRQDSDHKLNYMEQALVLWSLLVLAILISLAICHITLTLQGCIVATVLKESVDVRDTFGKEVNNGCTVLVQVTVRCCSLVLLENLLD